MITPSLDIPIPAWEQAVIIALFAVLILATIVSLGKLMNDQRKSQTTMQVAILDKMESFLRSRDENLRQWMDNRDQSWQEFLERQGNTSAKQEGELARVVNRNTDAVIGLKGEVRDLRVVTDARLDAMLDAQSKANVAERVRLKKGEA